MTSAELLVDAVGRIREVVHRVVDGLTAEQLVFRVDPETDSIAWLVWHLTGSRPPRRRLLVGAPWLV